MSNVSLALKYRPQEFGDVVKQDANIEILQRQVRDNLVKQAYLFAGASGCGKTTTARILAKMLDAEIIELNCADNNSVDDIRNLIQEAQLKPLTGKFKVYILDECHMFSKSAFNAMLKLLEEPPKHCIFILCTTDPQNILPTVLGRLQRFNFSRIPQKDIAQRLKFILDKENEEICEKPGNEVCGGALLEYTDEALAYIARLANGGMRDAISKLDTIIDYGEAITVENVIKCCGLVNYETILDLSFAILDKARDEAVSILDELYYSGTDMLTFLRDFYMTTIEMAKANLFGDITSTSIPPLYENDIKQFAYDECIELSELVAKLVQEARYEKCNLLMIEGILLREMK